MSISHRSPIPSSTAFPVIHPPSDRSEGHAPAKQDIGFVASVTNFMTTVEHSPVVERDALSGLAEHFLPLVPGRLHMTPETCVHAALDGKYEL